jgi:hypothetical protein
MSSLSRTGLQLPAKIQKFSFEAGLSQHQAAHGRGNHAGFVLSDTPTRHAEMLGADHHAHPLPSREVASTALEPFGAKLPKTGTMPLLSARMGNWLLAFAM